MKLQQSCFFNRTLSFVFSILNTLQMSDLVEEKTKAGFAFVSQPQCLLLCCTSAFFQYCNKTIALF